ncbi:AAA family ATPase [Metapseudomonas otitidis]|uniref:trifunctional serine/threonine-protein kinase/ATP-binding protein/sensor histidine kinase n=1 Tax=Metapseudomonas otitidis TaxID=319939 RepID=UPI003A8BE5B8
MSPPPLLHDLPDALAACFDEHWLARVDWQPLDRNGELSRWRVRDSRTGRQWLVVRAGPQAAHWELAGLDHEYALGSRLDPAWALLPVARLGGADGTLLVLDDDAGMPLSLTCREPLAVEPFLRLALAAAQALGKVHRSGLAHRNLCPDNLFLMPDGRIRLTGFGQAGALENAAPGSPALNDRQLAYLPPERDGTPEADLYALGVCFFQWLTGRYPFVAGDPLEWQHRHAAVAAPAPSQLRSGVPAAVDALLAAMLAKQADARPRQAAQVESELRRCLEAWREGAALHRTAGGAALLVAREAELATLAAARERLRKGQGGAVLVAGEAGIGKTSLMRRFRREEDDASVLFASAKCELSRRRAPYEALAGLFGGLCERLLAEAPAQAQRWREHLQGVVGTHAQRVVRLIPPLAPLLGDGRLPAEALPPSEARRYLHGVLQRLLGALARREHPLLLFVDDLQWIDEESRDFLCELAPSAFDHCLLVLAYRPAECRAGSLAAPLLAACEGLGERCVRIDLAPLGARGIGDLLGAGLSLQPEAHARLAGHLEQQGHGNPLYLTQFAALLREAGDTPLMADGPVVDVASLLEVRLRRLPESTRELLGALALLGNRTPLDELAQASGLPADTVAHHLHPAREAGLLEEQAEGLAFAHDALLESVRGQLPAQHQAGMHAGFARQLLAGLATQAPAAAVFRVAAQVLRVTPATLGAEDRRRFVDLLLRAACLAADAVAPGPLLDYLHQAGALLQGLDDPARAREVELLHVHGLILGADYLAADTRLQARLADTADALERIALQRLRVEIHCLRGDYPGALACVAAALAERGVVFPCAPTLEQAAEAWQALLAELDGRPPAYFAELPEAQDAEALAVMELLAALVVPGSFIQPNLMLLATAHIARMALQHGLSAAAVQALAWLGVAAAERFECHAEGFAFSAVARRLAEQPAYAASRVSALVALDQVSVWTQSLPFALECAEQAYRASLAQGSPSFACYANNHIVSDLLVLGAPIERMLGQIDSGLELARNLEFLDAQTILHAQARYIRRLAGEGGSHLPIPDVEILRQRVAWSHMGPLRFWWSLFEGLLAFLEGQLEEAAVHLDAAWALTWSAPVHIHQIDLAMFSVLNRAALQTATGRPQDYAEPLRRLRLWAGLNPRYFADRLALAEAEVARAEGDPVRALRLYERAIACAEACGAIHLKGLSHELAARCHEALELPGTAREHLRQAHAAWRRWGAHTLAVQLEQAHPFLCEGNSVGDGLRPVAEQLDRLSITRACQALSREIEPAALIETLLANAAMHAGAGYVALLLHEGGNLHVEACGQADHDGVTVRLQPEAEAARLAPLGLVREALERREPVLVEGPYALRCYTGDPYLGQLENGTVLCLPLLKQREVVGALYLENRLTTGAIDPARIDLLALLAAQAAISLSHARLYGDLLAENRRRRDSESTLRRTQALLALGQEVSRYGTFVWRVGREPSFWSAALVAELRLEAPADGAYLSQPGALVHADDRARFGQALEAALAERQGARLEFRSVSMDGSPRYLELVLEPAEHETFIGVVSDVTERRRTEAELRAARSELDRTSQATILGELAASISHEINQPLAAILSNAGASIRWLERDSPSVEEALEGLRDILAECRRAADIVRATRALARQAPSQRRPLALGKVIRQVLAITRAELDDKHVDVSLRLASGVTVEGDAIQLQQVMRNLIQNAVEAMQCQPPSTRRLVLESQVLGSEVLVLVEDSGPGVAEETQGRIFQAFFSTKASGMGMGLAICESILCAHGGRLGATRGRRGESLFFFTLPLAAG